MNGESALPLSSRERWFYGGIGALAPIVVAALAIDMVTVFERFSPAAALGYTFRCLLLFAVGGFVAFLHHKETDAWRCFVIGISAPALITTALAGKSNPTSPHADLSLPALISTANAQSAWLERQASLVPTTSVSALREGAGARFQRGFFGTDPLRAVVAIASESVEDNAKVIAAAAQSYFQCFAKDTQNKGFLISQELREPPDPVVITAEDIATALVQFSDARTATNYANILSRIGFRPRIIISTQSKLEDDVTARFLKPPTAADGAVLFTAEFGIDVDKVSKLIVQQCRKVGVQL